MREFVLLRLRTEPQGVDNFADLAEVVAALDLVLDLAEDFTDFVFDGGGAGGLLFEGLEIGEEFAVDEVTEVVAGDGAVVVELAAGVLGGGPGLPAVGFVEDEGVLAAFEFGFHGFVAFEGVEVLEEEQPGGLFGVVEFGGATAFLAEDVIYVFEGLFEH